MYIGWVWSRMKRLMKNSEDRSQMTLYDIPRSWALSVSYNHWMVLYKGMAQWNLYFRKITQVAMGRMNSKGWDWSCRVVQKQFKMFKHKITKRAYNMSEIWKAEWNVMTKELKDKEESGFSLKLCLKEAHSLIDTYTREWWCH